MTWYQRLGLALLLWATLWMPGANESGIKTALLMGIVGTALFVIPKADQE